MTGKKMSRVVYIVLHIKNSLLFIGLFILVLGTKYVIPPAPNIVFFVKKSIRIPLRFSAVIDYSF
jgi:hypothetical protein